MYYIIHHADRAHVYQTFGAQGVGSPIPTGFHGGLEASMIKSYALLFVQSYLNVSAEQVGYRSGFSRGGLSVAYVQQLHNGIPFANTGGNIVWNKGDVVAFGSSFVVPAKIAASKPSFSYQAIISVAEEALGGKFNDHPPTLEYLVLGDGSVALTHVVQIQNEDQGTWYEAFVDAHTGQLRSVTDFVAYDSYNVVPITKVTLDDGQKVVDNPADPLASPAGWHNVNALFGRLNFTTTSTRRVVFTLNGNNVFAYTGAFRTARHTSAGRVFDTKYDVSKDPTVTSNKDAATANAFYIANNMHDITYRYGFTEVAYNFQWSNNQKGGADRDFVMMSVQDPSGTNNANFATPPDGQPGTCRMYIFTLTSPRRDGAVENDIVVHEITHGVTNRLTGGGTGRCLQTLEAGGMGEGWSDAMADWIRQNSTDIQDFVVAPYVTNKPAGIRSHPYSTNSTTNPLTYASIGKLKEVHQIGEVWANILHVVLAALVAEHGFSASALTNPNTFEGNIVFMHLFIDGLSIQPCNPTRQYLQLSTLSKDLHH
ncbi:hypothetical protein C0991_011111 [Blastosporella zonata]|nr:hypothetical protein C0991_011111 [Blastosporella zonata]